MLGKFRDALRKKKPVEPVYEYEFKCVSCLDHRIWLDKVYDWLGVMAQYREVYVPIPGLEGYEEKHTFNLTGKRRKLDERRVDRGDSEAGRKAGA
jgi:hypothetical protein